jgi:hypothetical protein
MALSKKHYETFAARICVQLGEAELDYDQTTIEGRAALRGAREQIKGLAQGLATTFAWDNPRFARARFLAACGFEG